MFHIRSCAPLPLHPPRLSPTAHRTSSTPPHNTNYPSSMSPSPFSDRNLHCPYKKDCATSSNPSFVSSPKNIHLHHHLGPLGMKGKSKVTRFGASGKHTARGFYRNFRFRKIDSSEHNIILSLKQKAIEHKVDSRLQKILRSHQIWWPTPNDALNRELVVVPIESLFQIYLQLRKEDVRPSILSGKLVNKIILPFLRAFAELKRTHGPSQDSPCSALDLRPTPLGSQMYSDLPASISRILYNDVLEAFKKIRPKQSLNLQLDRDRKRRRNIYEQVQRSYENCPFDSPIQRTDDKASIQVQIQPIESKALFDVQIEPFEQNGIQSNALLKDEVVNEKSEGQGEEEAQKSMKKVHFGQTYQAMRQNLPEETVIDVSLVQNDKKQDEVSLMQQKEVNKVSKEVGSSKKQQLQRELAILSQQSKLRIKMR